MSNRSAIVVALAFIIGACDKPPQRVDDSSGATAWAAVGTGTYNSCATTAAGAAYCWGFDLVTGCPQQACAFWTVPTLVPGSHPSFTSISTGGPRTCAIASSGDAYCWGDASPGGLGDGTTGVSATPVRVNLPSPVQQLSAGYGPVCAVTTDSVGFCWPGKAGPSPQPVPTALRFKSISAGNTQVCAVDANDDAYCWGSGYGSLGIGLRDTACAFFPSCFSSPTPQLVDGGLKWSSISAGNAFTCAVTIDHRGYCWGQVFEAGPGDPQFGALGNGQFGGSKSPVPVAGGLEFKQIDTGTRHACGLTLDGAAYCWGNNASSELGTGSSGGRASTPQRVVGSLTFESISADDVTCGVSVNKNMYCWGITAAGMLGDGTGVDGMRSSPTRVAAPHP
jgi:alpha-tubulin suppressor-like RCC1 family protein